MDTQNITIWAGYIGRTKNVGEGFATVGPRSAHIMRGVVFTREATEDELEAEPENRVIICLPSSTLGGGYCLVGKTIGCKSEGHAKHIMARKGWLAEQLETTNWFVTPQEAAKYAYNELCAAAKFDGEKPKTLDEAIDLLRKAGILQTNQALSARWFKKPFSRTRIVLALGGEPSALGCIRRDAYQI